MGFFIILFFDRFIPFYHPLFRIKCRKFVVQIPRLIHTVHRIIQAVCIQVKLLLLFCPHLDDVRVVRIDEPHGRRIVVPALEIVQACFGILIVPSVANRVQLIK